MKTYSSFLLFLYGALFSSISMNVFAVAAETPSGQRTPSQSEPATPPSESSPRAVKPMREVWPHELMNFRERYNLWLKMRAARSPAERMELLANKYAQLEKRSMKLGVTLREPDSMIIMRYGERHPGIQEEGHWGSRREYGWHGPVQEHPYGYGGGYGGGGGTPWHEPFYPRYEGFRPLPPTAR